MLKVAICFSGQIRTFKECWPTYLDFISKYDCDCFGITTPFETRTSCPFNVDLKDYPFKKVLYRLDEIIPDPWYDLSNLPKSPGQNMLTQFLLIELVNNLRIEYAKENNIQYDWIVRTRFDNKISGELPDLNLCDPNKIYIPSGNDNPEGYPGFGISDRFAIAKPQIMDIYCNKMGLIDDYMKDPNHWYFAEVILKWILDQNKIDVVRFGEIVKINRLDGSLV